MTAVMHRLHGKLDGNERYPLPPREIVGSTVPEVPDETAIDATLVAHFAYGALSGSLLAALTPRPDERSGVMGGLGIWLASYMGWIPAFGILKPATRHPNRRNALMMFAHVVWGWGFAVAQRDLLQSRPAFADGPLRDAAV